MWLLQTKDARLKYFVSPEQVGGYMILSHVWGKNEQTFQDIQALPSQCAPRQTPRDIASRKIREACKLAEKWRHDLIWIDSCCIDKSSSAELSEAINSMFRYYSLASWCFAYLEDVSSNLSWKPDVFKKSKWHTRGWTLQELIAPKYLTFVSNSWTVIGHKESHAELVKEATGVPVDVLQDRKQMKNYSIAQRMSWAARRVTTREEDEAYCLLGIFDINMPTLYGEGRKAFRRLQEEIMKQSPDTTLFAWGLRGTCDELIYHQNEDHNSSCQEKQSPDTTLFPWPLRSICDEQIYHQNEDHNSSCQDLNGDLFATSPSSFLECSLTRFVDPTKCITHHYNTEQHGYIMFTSTPHGVSTEIPIIAHEGQLLAHLGWIEGKRFLLLLLQPLPSENIIYKDKFYRVGGVPLSSGTNLRFPRVIYAPDVLNDTMLRKSARPEWRKVYLAHEDVIAATKAEDTSVFESVSPVSELLPLHYISPFHFDSRHLPRYFNVRTFNHRALVVDVQCAILYIHLGVCTRRSPVTSPQQVIQWAHVEFLAHVDWEPNHQIEHDCSKDHISSWPDLSRRFGWSVDALQVTLSFTPSKNHTERTLVLRLGAKHVKAFDNDCEIWYPPTPLRDACGCPRMSTPEDSHDDETEVMELSDYDDEIEEMEYLMSPGSSDAVPAQPSAAVDEPVASSSPEWIHTESYAHGLQQAEGMQPGTRTHKRGYAEMKEGTTEDSEVEEGNHQWKRPKATVEQPPQKIPLHNTA